MGNIIWLASYPKSGNTWMRILLTNYLRNADKPANINMLGTGGPIASARQAFDDHVGIEASDLTEAEIERYRPFVYDEISAAAEETVFLKIHDALTYNQQGYPLISKEATRGVLYLLRNPLDVAVSYAHHSNFSVAKSVKAMGMAKHSFVANPKRLHNQLVQRLLTWSGHVQSWVDEPGLDVHIVRYEDLQADTTATFSDALRFAGFDTRSAQLAQAIEFSNFKIVKEQEQEHGFGEKMPASESFFRKGEVGSWREELTPELVEKVCNDHGDVMKRFGYLTAEGDIVY